MDYFPFLMLACMQSDPSTPPAVLPQAVPSLLHCPATWQRRQRAVVGPITCMRPCCALMSCQALLCSVALCCTVCTCLFSPLRSWPMGACMRPTCSERTACRPRHSYVCTLPATPAPRSAVSSRLAMRRCQTAAPCPRWRCSARMPVAPAAEPPGAWRVAAAFRIEEAGVVANNLLGVSGGRPSEGGRGRSKVGCLHGQQMHSEHA